MSERRCEGPGCRKQLPADHRAVTCSQSCGSALGHRKRASWRSAPLRRCAREGCGELVPRREGESDSMYRRRRFHASGCRWGGARASWRRRPRVCALAGCGVEFYPREKATIYHSHPCSVAARGRGRPRETKPCKCGCGPFERPAGLSKTEWTKQLFASRACYWRWLGRTGTPGAARNAKRTAPRPVPSRDRRKKAAPAPVAAEEAAPTFRLGAVPETRPVVRTVPRPSFGLSRRRSA